MTVSDLIAALRNGYALGAEVSFDVNGEFCHLEHVACPTPDHVVLILERPEWTLESAAGGNHGV